MAIWSDIAAWVGPTPNKDAGGMTSHIGVVLHVQQGTEAGTESWQKNPSSQVSSHFLAPKNGGLRQMVDTSDKAWAEVDGNPSWISVECEGYSGESLTAGQLNAIVALMVKAHEVYGVPLAISNSPYTGGLGYHAMGGVAWGNHPDCPGNPIISQRGAILQAAINNSGNEVDLTPEQATQLSTIEAAVTKTGIASWGYEHIVKDSKGNDYNSTPGGHDVFALVSDLYANVTKLQTAVETLTTQVSKLTPAAPKAATTTPTPSIKS